MMHEISKEEMRKKAFEFNDAGFKWHFHVLLPKCKFNEKPLFAFALEGPNDQRYVYYSQNGVSDLGKELAPLAHKAQVLNPETTPASYKPSGVVQTMIERAKVLNKEGVSWHHHVTFPRLPIS